MSVPDEPTIPQGLYTPHAPASVRVLENRRITPETTDEVRHLVLDLSGLDFRYREGQSIGVVVPDLPDRGHASQLRFYSIATSRDGDDGAGRTLAICVKRTRRFDPETGDELPGATGYLCGLTPGAEVAIAGPFGKTLLLPEDPKANLVLVATGTGIAPFRGFLRRLFAGGVTWSGQVRLYAGARSAADLLYREELEALQAAHPNFRVAYALSQEQQTPDGQRQHVHHRMTQDAEELWRLLDADNTYLYLCGIKGMEDHVERVFEELAHRDGISWRAFHRMLLDTGRLLVETY